MSAPSQRIWPELAGNRPASIFTVVDLPLPLGPRYPVTWPGGTVNVTWSTTARLRYFFVRPRTSNIALLLVAELDTAVAELFQGKRRSKRSPSFARMDRRTQRVP